MLGVVLRKTQKNGAVDWLARASIPIRPMAGASSAHERLGVSNEDPVELFDLVERLGEGSYGEVYSAVEKKTGAEVAIKVIPLEADIEELVKEIEILKMCDSPQIVSYRGAFIQENDLWVRNGRCQE